MSKGIELTQSQIKAKENGATMFLFPISSNVSIHGINKDEISYEEHKPLFYDVDEVCSLDFFINEYSPIQKGDKDIYIKVQHTCDNFDMQEDLENKSCKGCYPEYSFSECIDVRIVRIQDINGNANIYNKLGIKWCTPKSYEGRCINMETALEDFYNIQLKERGINRIYKYNDYVILAEFKY